MLPLDGWLFRTDPEHVGVEQEWYAPGIDTDEWEKVGIGMNWDVQGYPDYNGYGWYRRKVEMSKPAGKKAYLEFGAVDEEAVVYVDGERAGSHEKGVDGWDDTFRIDITEFLGEESEEHLIAVQVYDSMLAGGIWKPVWLEYE
jgi:hypothetical protein